MKIQISLAGFLAMVMLVPVSPVSAQQAGQQPASGQQPQQPARPSRPLFGGSVADPNSHQALNVTFSALGGYDDNVYAQGGIALPDPRAQVGGAYSNLLATLDYVKRGRQVSFTASGGSGYRYYQDVTGLNGATPWANLGLSGSLGRRTTFSLSGGASYSPYYGFGVFPGLAASETPGQAAAGSADRALFAQHSYTYTAAAGLGWRLTQRTTLLGDYAFRRVDYRGERLPLDDQQIGLRLTSARSRTLSLRLGYAFHQGDLGISALDVARTTSHDFDIGFDRTFGRLGQSSFGLALGPSIMDTLLQRYYRGFGSAYLAHAIGRSWKLRADYRRGLQFVEGFARPFFVDALSLSIRGFIGPRVELYGSGGYSSGELGLGVLSQSFATYTGTAGVRFALSRYLALYSDYLFYHYLFNEAVVLPPGVSPGLDRNGIRAGVTVWLPLLR